MKRLAVFAVVALCGAMAPFAHAYVHPCVPETLQDLATIKANLTIEPWKSGYAVLTNYSTAQLSYAMEGPFANVGRTPDTNLTYWKNDMTAVYNLAQMWYFTGNTNYAQKAHDILLAWANTQTTFSGQEMALSLGDYALCYAGGADILRGTWPGWTSADTTAVINYFENLVWPESIAGFNTTGPANKGYLTMESGIAVAAFCDDTNKFNHVIQNFRTLPASGLPNTLPTGEMGETGRDLGHAYGGLQGLAFVAEVAWKQGIDLYSELDNRIQACGEYYARNSLTLTNTPFVNFGTIDYTYYSNNTYFDPADREGLYFIQNAYKVRRGIPTPWIDFKLQQQPLDSVNWMFIKPADFSTATPLTPIVRPSVSVASSGLTLTTLGTNTPGRSVSYTNGVWTMTGLGGGTWVGVGGRDDCQFAYQAMTNDCALVAKVTSCTFSGSQNGKMGMMIRDNLTNTVSQRAWISITPTTSGTNLVESREDGWSDNWGGANWSTRSQPLPPPLPYWLKIERIGLMINTYTSQDGTTWAPILSSYYTNLPSTVYMGLFVCSGNTTNDTATFANLAFTGGTGGLVSTPAAPAALLASGSAKSISVRWLPSFGATSYNLLRSTNSGTGYAAVASNLSTATTSYVDTAVSAGTTYYYVVQAKNSAGTSTNSPEFGAALIPAQVNLAFGGTSSADFNSGSVYQGSDSAFDGDPGSKWYGYNAPTGWIQYDFGSNNAQLVTQYSITTASDVPTRDPKNWTFLGSQDGTNWTTLDTQSGQTYTNRMQLITYPIANTNAYRFYQLNVTANNGDGGLAIGGLGLWGNSGHTIPDGTYSVVNRNSNLLLAASNGGTTNGTPVVQWSYDDGSEQKWTFAYLGNGQYRVTGLASGRALDVTGVNPNNGTPIEIWDWHSGGNQIWVVKPVGDGYFKLTALFSGSALDVYGLSTANGGMIDEWSWNNGFNQHWSFMIAP